MVNTRRTLFSMTLMLVGAACDTGADDQGDSGGDAALATGGTASSPVTQTSSTGTGTGTNGVTTSATNSETSSSSGGSSSNGGSSNGGAGGAGSSGAGSGGNGGASAGGSGGAETSGGGSAAGGSGGHDTSACDDPALEWKSGRKTNYTSYPDPGSEECIVYNGCMWAGWFAHCDDQQSEEWVAAHNIAAMFPDTGYELHDICLRSGDRTMIVTVYDTCGDDDCDGCCTENKGNADALIDLESFTNARWGLQDGAVEWADLGPTSNNACE